VCVKRDLLWREGVPLPAPDTPLVRHEQEGQEAGGMGPLYPPPHMTHVYPRRLITRTAISFLSDVVAPDERGVFVQQHAFAAIHCLCQ